MESVSPIPVIHADCSTSKWVANGYTIPKTSMHFDYRSKVWQKNYVNKFTEKCLSDL